MKRKFHAILLLAFFILYALTFLPNFNVFNEMEFIGPLPEALAWVLFLNVLNTALIFVVYFMFFKPFAKRVEEKLESERGDS